MDSGSIPPVSFAGVLVATLITADQILIGTAIR